MKAKNIYIFASIICLCFLCLCSMTITTFAVSPNATLIVDGNEVETFLSVQGAVDAIDSTGGNNFVIEIAEGTVSDAVYILQIPDKNIVLRPKPGASVTFTNTITIDGNSNYYGSETLLIQGFNFDFTSGAFENCIHFALVPSRAAMDPPPLSYPHNITINGCTFKGVYGTTVAVQSLRGGSRNIAIMNCTATDIHSFAQLKAVAGYAFIQNCIVSNASEGGVNFYGTGDLTVDSCKFDVVGYAVRSGQNDPTLAPILQGSVNINNSILNSNSSEFGTIVLRGESSNNINILHSILKNESAGGAVIENLYSDYEDEYDIDVVESDLTGEITNINLSTINTIDDPNIPNEPVSVIDEPEDQVRNLILFILLIPILVIILVILVIVLAILIVRLVIRFVRFLIGLFGNP